MTLVVRPPARLANDPTVAVALLALVAGHFTYNYVDYAQIHRVGAIPASALILALRLVVGFVATAAAIAVARIARPSTSSGRAEHHAARGEPVEPRVLVAVVALVVIQLAYFSIDQFTDYRLRIVSVVAVLAATVGASRCCCGAATPSAATSDRWPRPACDDRGRAVRAVLHGLLQRHQRAAPPLPVSARPAFGAPC